jgi:hypothetical protein
MGFWGTLGKGLLKAAPIAASFIPGVGPIAGMAIGAGTRALSNKLEGRNPLAGAIEGGMAGYGAGKGLGPSKLPMGAQGPMQSGGWQQKLGGILGGGGGQQQGGGGFQQMLMDQFMRGGYGGDMRQQSQPQGPFMRDFPQQSVPQGQRYPQQGGPAIYRGQQMRTPNLSNPIEQGRMEGLERNPEQQYQMRRQPTRY